MIKTIFLFWVLLFSVSGAFAQTMFTYDAAGNRVMRQVVMAPDLTPFITLSTGVMAGPTTFDTRLRILNLNSVTGVPTTGALITVRILKNVARWNFVWDPSGTNNGLGVLNNSIWTYSTNTLYHIWTTTEIIPKGSSRYIGFTSLFSPGATTGSESITVTIVFPSGGEINNLNQTDVEVATFYP